VTDTFSVKSPGAVGERAEAGTTNRGHDEGGWAGKASVHAGTAVSATGDHGLAVKGDPSGTAPAANEPVSDVEAATIVVVVEEHDGRDTATRTSVSLPRTSRTYSPTPWVTVVARTTGAASHTAEPPGVGAATTTLAMTALATARRSLLAPSIVSCPSKPLPSRSTQTPNNA
jgi:hypothetical protein